MSARERDEKRNEGRIDGERKPTSGIKWLGEGKQKTVRERGRERARENV